MSDGIDRPDWSGGSEHVESGRSTPIGTPISRPDWGSAAPKEYVAGLHITQNVKPVQRRDWGDGDYRQGQEYQTPDTTHPLAHEGNAEPAQKSAEPSQMPTESRESVESQRPLEIDPRVTEHLVGFVGTEPAHAALDWLESVQNAELKNVPIQHAYDFRQLSVSPENQKLLTSFANAMAKSGASQSEVTKTIEWYQNLQQNKAKIDRQQSNEQVVTSRQTELHDVEHRDTAGMELRAEWGADYDNNIAAITRHLDTLPQEERDYLLRSRIDGRAFGNDPERLKLFLDEAKTNQADGLSQKDIEQILRTNRSRYDRDVGMQSRYRQLLET